MVVRFLTLIHSIFLTRILTARRGIAALLPASAKAFAATSTQLAILCFSRVPSLSFPAIPRSLGIVVRDDKIKNEILNQVQNDGSVGVAAVATTSDSCTRGMLDS